jgi:hypothetical protein
LACLDHRQRTKAHPSRRQGHHIEATRFCCRPHLAKERIDSEIATALSGATTRRRTAAGGPLTGSSPPRLFVAAHGCNCISCGAFNRLAIGCAGLPNRKNIVLLRISVALLSMSQAIRSTANLPRLAGLLLRIAPTDSVALLSMSQAIRSIANLPRLAGRNTDSGQVQLRGFGSALRP